MDESDVRAAFDEFHRMLQTWEWPRLPEQDITPELINRVLFERCNYLIEYGLRLTRMVLMIPGAMSDDQQLAEATATLDEQLRVLRFDVEQLFHQQESERSASASAFRAASDFVTVRTAAFDAWAAIGHRFGQLPDVIDDVRDRVGEIKDAAIDRMDVLMTQATGTLGSIGQSIVNWLKKLGQSLWQLISKLITPKEWAISGEAGVNILGLQGTVTLEVTFGP
jgi:hypothetical protein